MITGKIFKKIILCFIVLTSGCTAAKAQTVIDCAESVYQGGIIQATVFSDNKLETVSAILKDSEGKEIKNYQGFRYDPGKALISSSVSKIPDCFVILISTGYMGKGEYIVSVYIDNKETPSQEIPVTIVPREFVRESIKLNENMSDLRQDNSERRERETRALVKLFAEFNNADVFADSQFMKPLTAEPCYITSTYGDIRKFIYIDGGTSGSRHNGIDYAAAVGSSIFACASGKVVFAGDRLITGNSVIIEHIPGLYSIYYHMNKLYVSEGMFVSKGSVLGILGSTGLVTGPHLHWEVRNQSITVDPDFLIENPIIDKEKIISIINREFSEMAEGG